MNLKPMRPFKRDKSTICIFLKVQICKDKWEGLRYRYSWKSQTRKTFATHDAQRTIQFLSIIQINNKKLSNILKMDKGFKGGSLENMNGK